jgi:ribose/xylose/arabinose/galactoside ABC-type transport system permease subunit
MNTLKKLSRYLLSEHLIWVILVVLCVFGLSVDGFLSPRNMMNILWSAAPLGCMVLGMFFVMVCSGVDLSLESTFGFANTIGIMFMVSWAPKIVSPGIAILITLAVGLMAGLANGLISVRLRVNPFLVTLATMLIMRGVVIYLIPEGVYYLPDGYTFLGELRIGGYFPLAVIVLAVLYLIAYFLTNHFSFGKSLFAIGNNAEAAYVAGINVARAKILTL